MSIRVIVRITIVLVWQSSIVFKGVEVGRVLIGSGRNALIGR